MDDYSYDTYDGGYEATDTSDYSTSDYSTYGNSDDGGLGTIEDTGACCDCGPSTPTELPPVPESTPDGGYGYGYGEDGYGEDGYGEDGDGYGWPQSPMAVPPTGAADSLPPVPPPLPPGWVDSSAGFPGANSVTQAPPAPGPATAPVFSPIATPYGNPLPSAGSLPQLAPAAVSDPIAAEVQEDMAYWFRQGTNYSCGPASVSQIIEDFTGQDLNNEWDVFNYADGQGWIEHGKGMTIHNLERAIDAFGVDSSVSTGSLADADRLTESGHGVVLFVDGAKYWPDYAGAPAPHFARLLDVDWAKGTALMSDSFTGGPLEVSIDALSNAWNVGGPDGGSQMLVTNGTDPDGVGAGAPVRF